MTFLKWSGADRAVPKAEPAVRPAGADHVDAGELGGGSENNQGWSPCTPRRRDCSRRKCSSPEALGDDVLESCLYILRDRLQGKDGEKP
jgi:hypothetical protein